MKHHGPFSIAILSAALMVPLTLCHCARPDSTLGAPYGLVETVNGASSYPEGPLWRDDSLYYVEYAANRVMRWDGKENRVVWTGPGCGPASMIDAGGDRFLVACYDQNAIVRITADGKTLDRIERGTDGAPLAGPNDFTYDGAGGFYFTTSGVFDVKAPVAGRVYHLTKEGRVVPLAGGLRYANGLALTDRGRVLLVNEHFAKRIVAFDVDGSALKNRRVFRNLRDIAPEPDGADGYTGPDGLEVDGQGNCYICQFGAARVLVTDREGSLKEIIPVPQRAVTNIALGRDGELFITAVADAWKAPYPGMVYRYRRGAALQGAKP